jgi:hypothetical protein
VFYFVHKTQTQQKPQDIIIRQISTLQYQLWYKNIIVGWFIKPKLSTDIGSIYHDIINFLLYHGILVSWFHTKL